MAGWTLYEGDCLEVMRQLPDNSVDAVVTDPPYGLSREPDIEEVLRHWLAGNDYKHRGGGFMGRAWDSFVPGPAVWREVLRVVKPGGHILCFAGTRTVDLMGIAIRLGGFEIRDCLQWLYGSGFPKSLDIGKAIDKAAGKKRPSLGAAKGAGANPKGYKTGSGGAFKAEYSITVPATPEAVQWNGWGTALKPAHEPICMARKPLSESTVAANVLKWGTGAINIEGCRVGTEQMGGCVVKSSLGRRTSEGGEHKDFIATSATGRFPANVLLDEEAAAMLDEQSGVSKSVRSQRGASRFFYVAKASKSERGEGNLHPTVKPVQLMCYLVRLITPPNGTVLDPFAGSGTTLLAAEREGFDSIGIEMNPEYCEIIRRRMAGMQPVQAALPTLG